MIFLILVACIVVFGLLWLIFPRASFAAMIAFHFYYYHRGIGNMGFWDGMAAVFIIAVIFVGYIIDIALIKKMVDK